MNGRGSAPPRYGAMAPGSTARAVIALTSRLPVNRVGLRLAILLRRVVTMQLAAGALDVERWGLRLRLHPLDNGCEKTLLFTPQMYEPIELAALAAEIDRISPLRPFVFVDVGANVGLFSFFVAARAGSRAQILAVEPEPGNLARMLFNLGANPGLPIRPLALALGSAEGNLAIAVDRRDRGGTRTCALGDAAPEAPHVRCTTLLNLLRQERISAIDALKIDVEGSEPEVLSPFFGEAPEVLWPRLVVIEDSRVLWRVDLFAMMAERGYRVTTRSRQNVVLRRD